MIVAVARLRAEGAYAAALRSVLRSAVCLGGYFPIFSFIFFYILRLGFGRLGLGG